MMHGAAAVVSLLLIGTAPSASAQAGAESAWLELLPPLGLTRADLGVRPSRWETRMTEPDVERLLADPLSAPAVLERWERALAPGADLLKAAAAALPFVGAKAPPMPDDHTSCDSLPPGLDGPLSALTGQLDVIARQTRAGIPSRDVRAKLERELAPLVSGEIETALDAAIFDEAAKFDAGRLVSLASDADAAVRAALPALRAALADAPDRKIRCGALLVGSRGDDQFSAAELAEAILTVDLGGRNRYYGPAAAAGAGQVRVIVDLGRESVFESTGPAAGSGRFGIGLLYAANAEGTTIRSGDFSAGAGFFGAGAAFIDGRADLETGSFSQGAGGFGAGTLELAGPARARARMAAQGFGFTRGVGLFAARGALDARCGLFFPDSREGLAWLSLCQGVGYGPRAYAAGGWGVARVDGAGSRLEASYFAQGAGYWRGGGLLSVFGEGTTLQARRYAQGSGVHTAVGALRVRARRVSAVNWGVGPGYGWDYGVGLLDAEGDELTFQNDWSGGRADANGRALVFISGSSAAVSLHGLSYGSFLRGAPSWALVSLKGQGHRLRAPGLPAPLDAPAIAQTPYGALVGAVRLAPDLSTAAVSWPSGDRTWAVERERVALEARLARARGLAPAARTRELLFILSQFGLASQQVGRALDELAKTAATEAPSLISALDPQRFDELIWIRLLSSALGRPAGWAAIKAFQAESGLRRSLVMGILRGVPLDVALEPALSELKASDWRSRREAAGILSSLLDRSRGEEPGRLAFLEDSMGYLKDGDEGAFLKRVQTKKLFDLYAALALADRLPIADRVALLELAASPFDNAGEPALKKYASLLKVNRAVVTKAFTAELQAARAATPRARKALAAAVQDQDPDVASAALVALGGLGSGADAALLGMFLASPSAVMRHGAVIGLARLGPAAGGAISDALESAEPRARAAAALAAGRSWDADLMVVSLRRALADPEVSVRLAGLSAFTSIQAPLLDRRKDLKDELAHCAQSSNPVEKATASLRLIEIPR